MSSDDSSLMWMDNLDEWILDANRIVTPRMLSRQLKMHINTAKECLYHYSRVKAQADVDLEVILLLSGRDKEDKALIKLLREQDAKRAEKKLFSKVNSKHVYAVGKSKALKSENLLAAALLEEVKEAGHSTAFAAVANKAAVPRQSAMKLERPKAEEPKKALPPPKVKKEAEVKKEVVVSETKKSNNKQPKGIAGMFAKAAASNPKKKAEEVKVKVKKEKDSPGKENRENEEKEKEEEEEKKKMKTQPKRKRIQV